MKKRIKTRKLGRTSNERKQLFRNLIRSLVINGFIITSEAKGKTIKPIVEKLVTLAKENSLTTVRRLTQETGKLEVARVLIDIGALFKSRPGGYLRIIKLANQIGDDTTQVKLEWVEKAIKPEVITPTLVAKESVKPEKNLKEKEPKVVIRKKINNKS